MISRIINHVEEYVARYTVLLLAVLTPAAALLGSLAADLGGADTPAGRAALGLASALGVALGAVEFLRNLGPYQKLRDFGVDADSLLDLVRQAKLLPPVETGAKPDRPEDNPSASDLLPEQSKGA